MPKKKDKCLVTNKTNRDSGYSIQHCQERAQQRYGLTITQEHYDTLDKQVKDFLAVCSTKGSRNDFGLVISAEKGSVSGSLVYVIKVFDFLGKEICLNYETKPGRDCVTTILPNIETRG